MSVARHHADWLSLVEVSGPFVSLPVLMRVFPQGLEPRDVPQARALRSAYEEWQDNPASPGKQHAWVVHVLTAVLGYPSDRIAQGQALPAGLEAAMPEMGETLRPDFALVGTAGGDANGQAQLLIAAYPVDQSLDKPVIGKHWKATPATRMMELLHGAGVSLGLVTNGERWMLVYAPRGETTGYASWYGALWLDEPLTLRAFHSLLGVRRFFGVAADSTLLGLLKESASDQQEVTDQLGYQVREAVEVLVQCFDALDKESNRTLLKGVGETALYEAALTIMMRLVFLFSAEERGLLHLGKPLYDDNYAVSTLQEQLQEVADRYGEEVLERRYDAWARLLATFRAVHGGVRHQDLLMQAYGGSLFNPDRYPFLEGRLAGSAWRSTPAEPLAVNNRVALHLLNSLQRLRTKIGSGGATETRRVSFRALGVEQIGHVYEGLLDHTAVRASDPVLGIKGTRSKEPELGLVVLESMLAQGQDKLVEFLKEETGRSVSSLRRALDEVSLIEESKLITAFGRDHELLPRLRPFASLIREDSFERPLVVLTGSVYVTNGTSRRSTGTHYTPPSLTEPVVQHALEPLVYEGPSKGWPREQWKLKTPQAILDLNVCDMAMGSGAFLVQVCRFLADRLVEAWESQELLHPGEFLVTPDGTFSKASPAERLIPTDANERITIARRAVADRCLYGVDINPMAVEMAKLSIWLLTLDAHRPFTFLDHALKCGDSLLGITSLNQLENFSLRPDGGKQQVFATLNLWRHIDEARVKRAELEIMPSDTPEQINAKAGLHIEAENAVAKLKAAADVLVAVELKGRSGRSYDVERESSADHMIAHWERGLPDLLKYANDRVESKRYLHWALEFPEIIERGGFDAIVGNPPFLGGKQMPTHLGPTYCEALKASLAESKGAADLVAYFFRRAFLFICPSGFFGLIATKSISETVSRSVGLDPLVAAGGEIIRAIPSLPWPGEAAVVVTVIFVSKTSWLGAKSLNGSLVPAITTSLSANLDFSAASRLDHGIRYSEGTKLYGDSFIRSRNDLPRLLSENPGLERYVRDYVNGDIFNGTPDCSGDLVAVDFGDLDKKMIVGCDAIVAELDLQVSKERSNQTRQIHETRSWLHWDKRTEFFAYARTLPRVLGCVIVSARLAFMFVDPKKLFAHGIKLFADTRGSLFAVLQSSIHEAWVRAASSKLGASNRYSTSTSFDTFPMNETALAMQGLEDIGNALHSTRAKFMISRGVGLNSVYGLFHDANHKSSDIVQLRDLTVEVDMCLLNSLGLGELKLDHGFQSGPKGTTFSISESVKEELLIRLLALNQQRYLEDKAELVAQGASMPSKRGRKKSSNVGQMIIDL